MFKILLIGRYGQVSTYLQRALQHTQYSLHVADREQMDLSKPESILGALRAQQRSPR